MKKVVGISPTGALGYVPFSHDAFERGLARKPDFIGAQSGSNDSGPLYVGASLAHSPRAFVKHDIQLMLHAALKRKIPLIITGAVGNGTGKQLKWAIELVREIAREDGLRFRMAVIDAEMDRGYLKRKLAAGKVSPLGYPRDMTVADIDRSQTITAMMGVEPILKALETGAELILTGRACDDATFAAFCARRGLPLGLSLHMGKILECGCLAATPTSISETMIGTVTEDYFEVEPGNPEKACTIRSVASHTLYERENPYKMPGPGGVNDLSQTRFEQVTPRAVRVRGSRWIPQKPYRVKLEGAAKVGERAMALVGLRDPILLSQLDDWIAGIKARVDKAYANKTKYKIAFHAFGRNGVMGPREPLRHKVPHEVGLVTEVLCDDLHEAIEICEYAQHAMFSHPYKNQKATAGNLAHLGSLEVLIPEHKEVYEFSIDHLLELDDPCECFPMHVEEVGAAH